MKLCVVKGKVWADRKVAQLVGARLLIVQPVTSDGKESGASIVAADPSNLAGSGDTVVVVTSTDAAEAFDSDVPVNACVVELVDFVE
jgi:ethanolamine utilization protein EutN